MDTNIAIRNIGTSNHTIRFGQGVVSSRFGNGRRYPRMFYKAAALLALLQQSVRVQNTFWTFLISPSHALDSKLTQAMMLLNWVVV